MVDRLRRVLGGAALVMVLVPIGTAVRASEVRSGEKLPAISVSDWSGRPFDFAQLRGRVVVIDFWASWCATCRLTLPAINAISQKHPELTVVAINIDKTAAPAEHFLAEHLPQGHMTLLRDPDGAVMARFGAAGMPALYLVDRDGIVRLAEAGYAADRLQTVEAMVDQLLHAESETGASVAAYHTE
ncbi:MAG TPA: TlpA disulfide reductase family protein [Candidatus Binatia bacterium]|nr:TlpA disulfide reductase family protein [Candidatus Binatia bacterium]